MTPSGRATTIELVRHADAYSRNQWHEGPDSQRPLTPFGQAQATMLADELGQVDAIYSSPHSRCLQTVMVLADRLGLEPAASDALAEARTVPVLDAGDAWVAPAWLGGRVLALMDQLLRRHAGRQVVVCTHGDVLSAGLSTLAGRDGLQLPDVSCPKGGRYTLRFDGCRCVAATAVPAPEPAR